MHGVGCGHASSPARAKRSNQHRATPLLPLPLLMGCLRAERFPRYEVTVLVTMDSIHGANARPLQVVPPIVMLFTRSFSTPRIASVGPSVKAAQTRRSVSFTPVGPSN